MKEGNGEQPERFLVLPASSFTDLEDPESRERFKELMKFQYSFSDEQLDRNIEMLRQQERWNAEANYYLLEITDQDHENSGRIGQLMWAMSGSFVGNRPLRKVASKELTTGKVNIDHVLCLVVKIDLNLVDIREDGGQYRLFNKLDLEKEQIEVEDEDRRLGVLLDWREDEANNVHGFYRAKFADEIVEKEDWLMMQEPTWQFRKANVKK